MEIVPKQKILLLITKSNFGGAQRYVYELAIGLPKDQFDVTVAFGGSGLLKDKLVTAGIRTIEIHSLQRDVSVFKDIKVFLELYRLFKKEKPDIVHLNSSKIGGVGGVAGRLLRIKKIIFTGHGWAFNEARNPLSRLVIGFLHWVTITLSTKTIIVSENTKKQISVLPFIQRKLVVVHNGITPLEFLSQAQAREKLGIDTQALVIGTISELHTNKGLDYLLEAFQQILAQYPHLKLIIIGEGEQRKNLEKIIITHNLTDSVSLIGFVDNARIYLKAFDIFTLTSRTEAFPYVILEAGLAERAVSASRVGGIPEIITSNESGILVSAGNQKEIVTTFTTLIKNHTQAETYGTKLKEKVTTDFSIEKMLKKIIAVYTH